MPTAPAFGGKLNSTMRDLPLGARPAAQRDQPRDARRQHRRPLARAGPCRARLSSPASRRASAERHRADRAVEFRDRHHHGGLDRQQAASDRPAIARASGIRPDARRCTARRARASSVLGSRARRCRQGRRPDEKPVSETTASTVAATVVHEVALDRRRAGRARWRRPGSTLQSLRFECRDHAVVVRGVAGQHIGSHQQHADRPCGPRRARQLLDALDDATARARVINADLRDIRPAPPPQRPRNAHAARRRSDRPACRTMLAMFSSEPASQYCSVRK